MGDTRTLEEEIEQLRAQLSAKKEEVELSEKELTEALSDSEAKAQEIKILNRKIEGLEKEIDERDRRNAMIVKEKIELENKYRAATAQAFADMKKERNRANDLTVELNKERETMKEERKKAKEERERYDNMTKLLEEERRRGDDDRRSALQERLKDQERVTHRTQQLGEELKRAKEESTVATRRADEFAAKAAQVQLQLQKLQQSMVAKDKSACEMAKEVEELKKKNADLTSQLTNLRDANTIKELKEEPQEMQGVETVPEMAGNEMEQPEKMDPHFRTTAAHPHPLPYPSHPCPPCPQHLLPPPHSPSTMEYQPFPQTLRLPSIPQLTLDNARVLAPSNPLHPSTSNEGEHLPTAEEIRAAEQRKANWRYEAHLMRGGTDEEWNEMGGGGDGMGGIGYGNDRTGSGGVQIAPFAPFVSIDNRHSRKRAHPLSPTAQRREDYEIDSAWRQRFMPASSSSDAPREGGHTVADPVDPKEKMDIENQKDDSMEEEDIQMAGDESTVEDMMEKDEENGEEEEENGEDADENGEDEEENGEKEEENGEKEEENGEEEPVHESLAVNGEEQAAAAAARQAVAVGDVADEVAGNGLQEMVDEEQMEHNDSSHTPLSRTPQRGSCLKGSKRLQLRFVKALAIVQKEEECEAAAAEAAARQAAADEAAARQAAAVVDEVAAADTGDVVDEAAAEVGDDSMRGDMGAVVSAIESRSYSPDRELPVEEQEANDMGTQGNLMMGAALVNVPSVSLALSTPLASKRGDATVPPVTASLSASAQRIRRWFACPHCPYTTQRSNSLKEHVTNGHERKDAYQCPHCTFSSSRGYNLRVLHMPVHGNAAVDSSFGVGTVAESADDREEEQMMGDEGGETEEKTVADQSENREEAVERDHHEDSVKDGAEEEEKKDDVATKDNEQELLDMFDSISDSDEDDKSEEKEEEQNEEGKEEGEKAETEVKEKSGGIREALKRIAVQWRDQQGTTDFSIENMIRDPNAIGGSNTEQIERERQSCVRRSYKE